MAKIRTLTAENIQLAAALKIARVDSFAVARHHAIDLEAIQWKVDALEEARPSWYERPGFVSLATMAVTIWSMGEMVSFSF